MPATLPTVSIQTTPNVKPLGWPQAQVQSFAEDAATKLGYVAGGDIGAIVTRLGGTVQHNDWHTPNATGYLEVPAEGGFTIVLSPYAGGSRKRFTIAHELGHYILHTQLGKIRPAIVTRLGSDRLEWEANWFAAGFLMPTTEFRRLLGLRWNDAQLATHFDVSMAAVEIRRSVLG
jgi:hypothetical protein